MMAFKAFSLKDFWRQAILDVIMEEEFGIVPLSVQQYREHVHQLKMYLAAQPPPEIHCRPPEPPPYWVRLTKRHRFVYSAYRRLSVQDELHHA